MTSDSNGTHKFRIYTKTGDKGTSALYNGQRLPKDDGIFHALGDVDELNSAVGIAREFCDDRHEGLPEQLEVIQSRLLDIGSAVATPANKSSERKLENVRFNASATEQLEKWLDTMDDTLPPLRNFILPSGGKAASSLHLARSICRRAERSIVPLVREEMCDEQVGIYMNRLSDYLFTAARFAAAKEEQPEVIYKKIGDSEQRELVAS
jgi:ATP:cob(I)alamin adenosyltransferase